MAKIDESSDDLWNQISEEEEIEEQDDDDDIQDPQTGSDPFKNEDFQKFLEEFFGIGTPVGIDPNDDPIERSRQPEDWKDPGRFKFEIMDLD